MMLLFRSMALLALLPGITACSEEQNFRSETDRSLKGEQNAQQVGDERGFITAITADEVKDATPQESTATEATDSDAAKEIEPVAEDIDSDLAKADSPPVLKTVQESVFGSPGQSPGQNPGQNPYQEGMDSQEPLAIKDVNYTGAGCPEGSVATNISDDEQAFTILFSEFYVEFMGDKGSVAEKNCRVSLTLDVPHGYQVSVLGTDLRGYADLNAGQTAWFYSDYSFDARSPLSFSDQIAGPTGTEGDFEINHELDVETWVWSACGESYDLDVDLTVLIESPASAESAVVTVDSLDGEMMHKMGLAWRTCE